MPTLKVFMIDVRARFYNIGKLMSIPTPHPGGMREASTHARSDGSPSGRTRLCAPVRSLLRGSSDSAAEAQRERKVIGSGMRQAAVLTATRVIALE
jgi:hypothetical protein